MIEPSITQAGSTKARRRQRQRAARQRNVANVDWQSEELSQHRRKAQEISQNDAGGPASNIVPDNMRNLPRKCFAQPPAERMLGYRFGEPIVHGCVLHPAS